MILKKQLLLLLLFASLAFAQDKQNSSTAIEFKSTDAAPILTTEWPKVLSGAEIVKRFLRDGPKDFVNDRLSYEFHPVEIQDKNQQIYTVTVGYEGQKYGTIWDPFYQLWVYDGYDPRESQVVYRVELKALRRQ